MHTPDAPPPRSSTAAAIALGALLGILAVASAVPLQLRALSTASDLESMMLGLLLVLTAAALLVLLRLLVVWSLVLAIVCPPLRPLAGTARPMLHRLAPALARRVSAAAVAGAIAGTAAFGTAASADDRTAALPIEDSASMTASAHMTIPLAPTEDPPHDDPSAAQEAGQDAAHTTAASGDVATPSAADDISTARDVPQLSWGSGAGESDPDTSTPHAEQDEQSDAVPDGPGAQPTRTATGDSPIRTVTVAPGDSLWSISEDLTADGILGDIPPEQAWPRLYRANRSVIGADPDRIVPGTVLTVPAGAAAGDAPTTHPTTPEESR